MKNYAPFQLWMYATIGRIWVVCRVPCAKVVSATLSEGFPTPTSKSLLRNEMRVCKYNRRYSLDISIKRSISAYSLILRIFLQRAQCSHCKRCISYSNSVCPSVRPSVRLSVCPSVTRRYFVKTTARSTVQFAPLDSKMCLGL